MAVGTRGAAMALQILTDQLTLISTRAGEGQIMPNTFLFVPHTSRISRPSYGPATEMMLINNVRMLIEMQWGMLTGFQNTLFLMHCRSILLRPWRNSGFATLHMCAIHNGI